MQNSALSSVSMLNNAATANPIGNLSEQECNVEKGSYTETCDNRESNGVSVSDIESDSVSVSDVECDCVSSSESDSEDLS